MTLDRNPKHLQPGMAEKMRLLLNDCEAEGLDDMRPNRSKSNL